MNRPILKTGYTLQILRIFETVDSHLSTGNNIDKKGSVHLCGVAFNNGFHLIHFRKVT